LQLRLQFAIRLEPSLPSPIPCHEAVTENSNCDKNYFCYFRKFGKKPGSARGCLWRARVVLAGHAMLLDRQMTLHLRCHFGSTRSRAQRLEARASGSILELAIFQPQVAGGFDVYLRGYSEPRTGCERAVRLSLMAVPNDGDNALPAASTYFTFIIPRMIK
jgi:hypothetical protein